MLHNERYRGVAVWNRTRKIRDPKTGRRVQSERPKSEWTVLQAPQLQIVSQELWEGVQRRLVSVKTAFTSGTSPGLCSRAYSAPYLLSCFLRCGVCGSNMVIVSGRGQCGRSRYGCPLMHSRGICSNSLHIRQDTLEQEVLGGCRLVCRAKTSRPMPWPNSNGSSKRKRRACAGTSGQRDRSAKN
jgi:site-specific DNA recombinase